jgi:hypothetical protein
MENRHEHRRSFEVFAADFFFLTMTEDFSNLLFHCATIISLLRCQTPTVKEREEIAETGSLSQPYSPFPHQGKGVGA